MGKTLKDYMGGYMKTCISCKNKYIGSELKDESEDYICKQCINELLVIKAILTNTEESLKELPGYKNLELLLTQFKSKETKELENSYRTRATNIKKSLTST